MYEGETKELKILSPYIKCDECKDEGYEVIEAKGQNLENIFIDLSSPRKSIIYITYLEKSDEDVVIEGFIYRVKDTNQKCLYNVEIRISNDEEYNGIRPPFPKGQIYNTYNPAVGFYYKDNKMIFSVDLNPRNLELLDLNTMNYEIESIEYPENDYLSFNIYYLSKKDINHFYYMFDDCYSKAELKEYDSSLPIKINKDNNQKGIFLYYELVDKKPDLPDMVLGLLLTSYNFNFYT